MPRIKCHYIDCVFLDEGYCSAAAIELDPDTGCATYSPSDEAAAAEEWEEEEEEWEEDETEDEDDELWDDEEDEF
jgi:formate hydrogenlyase subunit 6/NADH:ubiquinone oxidoreductase subunit I